MGHKKFEDEQQVFGIMKTFQILILLFLFCGIHLHGQVEKTGSTKVSIGIAGPELLHAGFTYRIANVSLLGLSAGAAPSMGEIWTSINAEHRLYVNKNSAKTEQKMWFFRQGVTFFPAARSPEQFAFTLTVGRDINFNKSGGGGITIDAGVFYLPENEEHSLILVKPLNLLPALRFQLYFPL